MFPMVKMLAWNLGHQSSIPSPATDLLGDLRQVTSSHTRPLGLTEEARLLQTLPDYSLLATAPASM